MNKTKNKVCIVGITFVLLMTIRNYYQWRVKNIQYTGVIVAEDIKNENFIIINPNNLNDRLILDFRKVGQSLSGKICELLISNDKMYFVVEKEAAGLFQYHIYETDDNDIRYLSSTEKTYVRHIKLVDAGENIGVFSGSTAYLISKKYEYNRMVNTYKKENTNILTLNNGMIVQRTGIGLNDDIFFLNEHGEKKICAIPKQMELSGWYKYGKSFVINDKNTSFVLALSDDTITNLFPTRCDSLGTTSENLVLLMVYPKDSVSMLLYNVHYSFIDVIRREHIKSYKYFLYDLTNQNVKGIDGVKYPYTIKYQNGIYNETRLKKLQKALTNKK